jgi:hypothetical protein|eukprot:SAG25_NODE_901_length_4855_cov_6.359966_4_plen_95_part_00
MCQVPRPHAQLEGTTRGASDPELARSREVDSATQKKRALSMNYFGSAILGAGRGGAAASSAASPSSTTVNHLSWWITLERRPEATRVRCALNIS